MKEEEKKREQFPASAVGVFPHKWQVALGPLGMACKICATL